MAAFTPSILIVEGDDDRREAMRALAADEGFQVDLAESQKKALSRLRAGVPDVLWSGHGIPETHLTDFVEVVRAAYKDLPILVLVDADHYEEGLTLLETGVFDAVREEDDERTRRAALRRAKSDARARAMVKEERGLLLGAQTRLSGFAPIVGELLGNLSAAFKESLDRPDISLRKVETICATAMSHFMDGVPVVIMAIERPSMILRPRGVSHALEGHADAEQRGFMLTQDKDRWREAMDAVSHNKPLTQLIRDAYGTRQCFLASLGPEDEPYGIGAFLLNHAQPPSPEEEELLRQVTANAGQSIRIARLFRTLLRRNAPNTPQTNPGF